MATMPLFNGTVYAFAQDGDTVYAGGTFTTVNGVAGYTGLAKFNLVTGAADTAWKPVAGNAVRALVLSPDKTFVIMGAPSGSPTLRKFLVNNNTAQSFVTVNSQVQALVIDGNYLYVSRFGSGASSTATSVQGTFVRPRVVKIDVTGNSGAGSIDATFVATNNSGGAGDVGQGAMAQDANYLYIGGNYTQWNNVTHNRIVKINKTDAATAADWVGGTGFDNTVQGLTVGSNGSIYAVGIFTTYKGVSTSGQMAKLNPQGTRDTGFTSSVTVTNGVWSISEYNSALYVGTQYNTAEAATSRGVLKSTNLTTFTKDAAFLTGTGFGTTGISGRAFVVGSNLFLTSSASTAYKGSAAGFSWAISTATAEETALISSDSISPTATLTSSTVANAGSTNSSAVLMSATFSESVTGLVVGALSLTNCTVASISGSGSSYSFTVVPSGQGAVSVTLPADSADDSAGNGNLVSNTYSFTYDTVSPTVAVTSPDVAYSANSGAASVNMSFTFSESVTGFSASTLSLTNCSVSSFSGSGSSYSAVITPTAPGLVQVTVTTAQDVAGNFLVGPGQLFSYFKVVPAVVSQTSVARNQLLDMALSTPALVSVSAVPLVQWKRVLAVYASPGKKKVVVSFKFAVGVAAPGRFLARIAGPASYLLSKMIIIKIGGQGVVIQRADFPTVSGMDIDVT